MASTSTVLAHVDKHFVLLVDFDFLHGNMDQESDLVNIHGLANSIFFIMILIAMRYFATRASQRAVREGKIRSSKRPDQAFVSLV